MLLGLIMKWGQGYPEIFPALIQDKNISLDTYKSAC